MVKGVEIFKEYFKDYTDQYVLIGGAACDIIFANNEANFRATRDLDIVLIIEALNEEFGNKFWNFIKDGDYQHKSSNMDKPQFYRFSKPKEQTFPKMIELFTRNTFELKEINGLTPIHVDDEISSLSAILLDKDYYHVLLQGKTTIDNLSVLRPEYLILFKAKAYLDLSKRKANGEHVDSSDIKKHKKDILRILAELLLENVNQLPQSVKEDINLFINSLSYEPYDEQFLKQYGLKNEEIINLLTKIYK